MAAFVQKVTGSIAGAVSGTLTITGVTAGNLLVFSASYARTDGVLSPPTLADSNGTTAASSVPNPLTDVDGPSGAGIWHVANAVAGTHVFTLSIPSGLLFAQLSVAEFSGMATTAPVDQATNNGSSSAASTTGGTTGTTSATTQANELVVAALCLESGTGLSNAGISTPASSGYTSLLAAQNTSVNTGGEHSYKLVTSTGTQSGDWTWTADTDMHVWQAAIATFKESGSGVSENLTGQTATSSEGVISRVLGYAVTGQTLTSSEGTPNRAVTYALAGQTATFIEGTPAAAIAYPLTAQTGTLTEGTLTASEGGNVTLSLAGQSITSSEGALAEAVNYGITAQTLTSGEGALASQVSVSLAGQSLTSSEGTIIASVVGDVTLQLSGLAAVFAQGTIVLSGTLVPAGRHKRYGVRDGDRLLVFDTRLEADQAKLAIAQRDLPAPKNPKRLKVKPIPVPRETVSLPVIERVAQQVDETDAYEELLRSQAYSLLVQRYDAWVKRQADSREEEEIAMILLHL